MVAHTNACVVGPRGDAMQAAAVTQSQTPISRLWRAMTGASFGRTVYRMVEIMRQHVVAAVVFKADCISRCWGIPRRYLRENANSRVDMRKSWQTVRVPNQMRAG